MLNFKRIIAVSLMVLMSNFMANLVLAGVDGPNVFWKFSLWGKRRAFTEGAETLSKRLSEETGGKFKLKIFYGAQLSKSKEKESLNEKDDESKEDKLKDHLDSDIKVMKKIDTVAVLGGGAAGFFAALSVKKHHPQAKVILFEKTTKVLAKVKISGGGRCNVTNSDSNIDTLCMAYPRGGKQLRNLFYRFNTTDTQEWFRSRGVPLKSEADGRVFPVSNQSQSIINCLMQEAEQLGVEIKYQAAVSNLTKLSNEWSIHFLNETHEQKRQMHGS